MGYRCLDRVSAGGDVEMGGLLSLVNDVSEIGGNECFLDNSISQYFIRVELFNFVTFE